jgi:3-hydroxymyristoyl/3-hydroxydecanoyl-(acyl carrier protein) dehydratase
VSASRHDADHGAPRAPGQAPRSFAPRVRAGVTGATGTRAVFDVHVPRDLTHFEGHFPGSPILAAVVQLDVLVLRQIADTWPALNRVARMTRLRFRVPIRPGDDLELTLERETPTRVRFEIACRGEACSSGLLHFREPHGE